MGRAGTTASCADTTACIRARSTSSFTPRTSLMIRQWSSLNRVGRWKSGRRWHGHPVIVDEVAAWGQGSRRGLRDINLIVNPPLSVVRHSSIRVPK
jgi:hypothetical protein